jgi:hypothetical protein
MVCKMAGARVDARNRTGSGDEPLRTHLTVVGRDLVWSDLLEGDVTL